MCCVQSFRPGKSCQGMYSQICFRRDLTVPPHLCWVQECTTPLAAPNGTWFSISEQRILYGHGSTGLIKASGRLRERVFRVEKWMRKALPPGPGSAISPGASWPAPLSLAHFSPSGPQEPQSLLCQQVLKSQEENMSGGLCWVPLIPFPRSYQAIHQQFPVSNQGVGPGHRPCI